MKRLGNDLWHDSDIESELITTKVCSQIGSKWNVIIESHVETCKMPLTGRFFEQFATQIIIYCVIDQPSVTQSRRSVLDFELSCLTFLRSMSCSMSIEQNLCREENFQLSCMSNAITCIYKGFQFRILALIVLPWYLTFYSPRMTILHAKNQFTDESLLRNITIHILFFLSIGYRLFNRSIQTHGLVVQASRIEMEEMGSIPAGCWNSL